MRRLKKQIDIMSRKYSEIPWKLQGMALLEEELENIKKS